MGVVYTFDAMVVSPVAWGPRVQSRPCQGVAEPASSRTSPLLGLRIAQVHIAPALDRFAILRRLKYNSGAYSRCFLEAGPHAVGVRLDFSLTVSAGGKPDRVDLQGSSQELPELAGCLRAALEALPFPLLPRGRPIQIDLPLVGGPPVQPIPALPARATATMIMGGARAALEAGDGEAAAGRFAALEQQSPSCESALGFLRALMVSRPWFDQPVDDAASAFLASRPSGFCLEKARPSLLELARTPLDEGEDLRSKELLELAITRLERLAESNDATLREEARSGLAAARSALESVR
jgi:hypothetical protein